MKTDRTDTAAVEALFDAIRSAVEESSPRWGEAHDNPMRHKIDRREREWIASRVFAEVSRLTAPQPGAAVPEGWRIRRVPHIGSWIELRSPGGETVIVKEGDRLSRHLYKLAEALLAAAPAPEARQPDGYAYRYAVGRGMTVLRMNGGCEVNGASPIEAIPYYFGKPAPEAPKCGPACARCGSTTGAACDERGCGYLTAGNGAPEAERAKSEAVDDAAVDRYLAAQRAYVEAEDARWGRQLGGGLHRDVVREACRAGLKAAGIGAAPPPAGQPEGVEALESLALQADAASKSHDERHMAITLGSIAEGLLRLASAQRAGKDGAP